MYVSSFLLLKYSSVKLHKQRISREVREGKKKGKMGIGSQLNKKTIISSVVHILILEPRTNAVPFLDERNWSLWLCRVLEVLKHSILPLVFFCCCFFLLCAYRFLYSRETSTKHVFLTHIIIAKVFQMEFPCVHLRRKMEMKKKHIIIDTNSETLMS